MIKNKSRFTEEGKIRGFIARSVDTTIRNIINNPMSRPEVKNKIKETVKLTGGNKGEKNPMYGKKHSKSTLLKIHKKKFIYGGRTYYSSISKKIMEQHLGRKLIPNEIIHHLDHNFKNNSIDNLHLFQTNSEHIKYHRFLRRTIKEEVGLTHSTWRFI